MRATYADLTGGERHAIEVEFVSRRPIDRDGTRFHRLHVADRCGDQFPVLIVPAADPLYDLKTGTWYRMRELYACDPADWRPDATFDCPTCGAPLRRAEPVDVIDSAVVDAASQLGIDRQFGVIDERTTVSVTGAVRTRIDDWRSMRRERADRAPDYVCDACDRTVSEWEVRQDRGDHVHESNPGIGSTPATPLAVADTATPTLGLAAGGASDATNFRLNVEHGYTPSPAAISDEGVFAEYYFDIGEPADTDALFAPRYATAVSEHPLTGAVEQYLAVGLDSTLPADAFERPQLELVVVLDVSGSMTSPFDAYYYDRHGRNHASEGDTTTKLAAAKRALCALTEQLRDSDRLGIVLFNEHAHVAKPLREVGATDMDAIRRHIDEVAGGGGTNLEDGFATAVDLLGEGTADPMVEHRVVFATDMMPNTGATESNALLRLVADAAVGGIHTTFLGVGLDENAELADALSGIRGANHHFVHSASEFEQHLGETFEYMVTPLVFDLGLDLDADGYEVAAVHGSPAVDDATDRLMHVGTLFPAPKRAEAVKGGIVLARLETIAPDGDVELTASWTERDGTRHVERASVDLPTDPGTYADDGIRKAVALVRYARELRDWSATVHDCVDPHGDARRSNGRGEHERESISLVVSGRWADRFESLRRHLAEEMAAIGDETLQQELDLLDTLDRWPPDVRAEVGE